MSDRFKLGVTGGIGSGKTTVCKVFGILGVPVFSADTEGKTITDSDPGVISAINTITGKDMYREGSLDRAGLAELIFSNKDLLRQVNEIVHPVVRKRFVEWSEQQEYPYVIFESAILHESGTWKILDRILTITAPVEERIDRVISRSSLTREMVLERMRNQLDDESKAAASQYVINNSENNLVIPALIKIHAEILNIVRNR